MPIFVVLRINRDPKDTYAAETIADALDTAMPDDGDVVEHGRVKASDAGAARLMEPPEWKRLKRRGDDWYNVGPGDRLPDPKENPRGGVDPFDHLFRNASAAARHELHALMAEAERDPRKAEGVLKHASVVLGADGVAGGGYNDMMYVDRGGAMPTLMFIFETRVRRKVVNGRFAIGDLVSYARERLKMADDAALDAGWDAATDTAVASTTPRHPYR